MAISGFGLRGYRSFGGEMQYVAPLTRLNLLVGQNNAGKSNVLQFAERVLGAASGGAIGKTIPAFSGLDVPQAATAQAVEFALAIPMDRAESILDAERGRLGAPRHERLKSLIRLAPFHDTGEDLFWIHYEAAPEEDRARIRLSATGEIPAAIRLSDRQLGAVMDMVDGPMRTAIAESSSSLTSTAGGGPLEDLRRVVARLFDLLALLRPVAVVRAIRQVAAGGNAFAGYSGEGLIEGLAQLQNPDVADREARARFQEVNRFVQVVLEDDSARIEVPHHRRALYVNQAGTPLPLENLGTGIHEVIILAVAAALLSEHLVCIEEPEIHLHPILQRKLLRYLAASTTNIYLIATHSAHMLDANLASISHVRLGPDGSSIQRASSPRELAAVCADLGYRPSDLVQSNAVIWVEGPSDRVYLRHWISLINKSLTEGIDYSIMFYGGRLLNHLTPDDPDIEDFISLRRLNRHIAIVIDSDRSSKGQRTSPTKKRVQEGFDLGPGFAWITRGYTIENYVPPALLASAVADTHAVTLRWRGGRYENPLPSTRVPSGHSKNFDKVSIARRVAELWTDDTEWPSDLRRQVSRLVRFIHDANGA